MPTIDKIKLLRFAGFFPSGNGQQWRNEENQFALTTAFIEYSSIERLRDVLRENGFVVEESEQNDKAELLEYAEFSCSGDQPRWTNGQGHALTFPFVNDLTADGLREFLRTNGHPVREIPQDVAKIEDEKIKLLLDAGFYRDCEEGVWKVVKRGRWLTIPIALAEAMTIDRLKETLKDMGFIIIKKEEEEKMKKVKKKEEMWTCHHCSLELPCSSVVRIEEYWLCNDCMVSQTFRCYTCGSRFMIDGRRTRGGVDLCRECALHYYTCENCECLVHEDNICGEDESLCSGCYDDKRGKFVDSWFDLNKKKIEDQKKTIKILLKKALSQRKIAKGHPPVWNRKDSGCREIAEGLGNLPISVFLFGLKADRTEDFIVILPREKVLPERNEFGASVVKFMPGNPSFEEQRFVKQFGIGINQRLRATEIRGEAIQKTKKLIRKLTKEIY